jgi:hypothetical protein
VLVQWEGHLLQHWCAVGQAGHLAHHSAVHLLTAAAQQLHQTRHVPHKQLSVLAVLVVLLRLLLLRQVPVRRSLRLLCEEFCQCSHLRWMLVAYRIDTAGLLGQQQPEPVPQDSHGGRYRTAFGAGEALIHTGDG